MRTAANPGVPMSPGAADVGVPMSPEASHAGLQRELKIKKAKAESDAILRASLGPAARAGIH